MDDLKLGNGEILKNQIRGNGSARFWGGFWKVFEGGFLYDAEGCEVHPKWSLSLAGERVGNAFWKES